MKQELHRKYTRRQRLLITGGLISILLFAMTIWMVLQGRSDGFDQWVSGVLGSPTDAGIEFMSFISFFGSSQFMVACYVVLAIWLLIRKKRFYAVVTVIAGVSGYFVVYFFKETFQRSRPYRQHILPLSNFSLPSGHACSGLLLYGIMSYLLWQSNQSWLIKISGTFFFLLLAFLIGLTRIYLGVHYASDVVAGFLLAAFFLSIVINLLERKNNG